MSPSSGEKRQPGNLEPPQQPQLRQMQTPPDPRIPRLPQPSRPFAQVEPPRVQEFEFKGSPPASIFTGTFTGQLSSSSSSAPSPVTYMPQTLFNPLAATTTKSSVVQEDNIKVTVDEEIEPPTLAQNVTIAEIANRNSRRLSQLEETLKTHHIELLAIPPNTPTQGMRTVVPPLHNPFASPGLPSDKQLAPMPEKKSLGFSADLYAISPPSTQLHKKKSTMDISEGSDDQPLDWAKYQNTPEYVSKHPTCALNLVCYRTGTKGCELHQIQTILESRFQDKKSFQLVLKERPSLIATDAQFFRALRDVYLQQMCGFWRKALFLKTLRGIRLLSVRPSTPLSFPCSRLSLNPKVEFNYKLLTMNSSRQQPDR
jgi:hypothetical protein